LQEDSDEEKSSFVMKLFMDISLGTRNWKSIWDANANITKDDVDKATKLLNRRPRKRLCYL